MQFVYLEMLHALACTYSLRFVKSTCQSCKQQLPSANVNSSMDEEVVLGWAAVDSHNRCWLKYSTYVWHAFLSKRYTHRGFVIHHVHLKAEIVEAGWRGGHTRRLHQRRQLQGVCVCTLHSKQYHNDSPRLMFPIPPSLPSVDWTSRAAGGSCR